MVPVYDFDGGEGGDENNRGALVKQEEEGGEDGFMESGGLDFTGGGSYSQYSYQDAIGILPSDFSPKGPLNSIVNTLQRILVSHYKLKVYQVVVENVPIVKNGYRPR